MRVLVCGGRDYADFNQVKHSLGEIHIFDGIDLVIQGGARGADNLARVWAVQRKVPVATYPADWATHGRGAGPIRNQHMLVDSRPDLVVAFPGGSGTADMVRRARAAGVRVASVAR